MSARIATYLKQQHLALLCLFALVSGGTAYAVDRIGGKRIKSGAVQSKHVRDGSLLAEDFAPGQLPAGTDPTPLPLTPSPAPAVPAGAVVFFLRNCPEGWSELTEARGRYLVGVPSNGTLGATAGTPLTNRESRAVGEHTHSVIDPGHEHELGVRSGVTDSTGFETVFDSASGAGTLLGSDSEPAATRITIDEAGTVPGTNAPYIQLRVCEKT